MEDNQNKRETQELPPAYTRRDLEYHPPRYAIMDSSSNQLTMTATDTESITDYSSLIEKAPLLMPQPARPGVAEEQALARGLQVPTRSYRLTSGFEYPEVLGTSYGISEDDWNRFTDDITKAAKLTSKQWRTVIGRSIGTMAVGGMILGVFGVIPTIMVAKRTRSCQEMSNLKDVADELPPKLAWWNENFFQPRGVLIRLDMPYETSDMEDMDLNAGANPYQRKEKHEENYIRDKASRKARIVIIPLDPNSSLTKDTPD